MIRPDHVDTKSSSRHGFADFPPGTVCGPRVIEDYEFVLIIRGECVFQEASKIYPAPPGAIILIQPNRRHCLRWDSGIPTRHGFIHFTLKDRGAGLPPTDSWPRVHYGCFREAGEWLLNHVCLLIGEGSENSAVLATHGLRHVLLAFLFDKLGTMDGRDDSLPPLVEKALAVVAREWRGDTMVRLTLSQLAKRTGTSESHLDRVFREAFRMPAMRTLRS